MQKTDKNQKPYVLKSAENIAAFIDFTFHKLAVSHLEWNGKTWYPWTTFFSSHPGDHEERPWDPDCQCYGYWGCIYDASKKGQDGYDVEWEEPPVEKQQVENIEDLKHIFRPFMKGESMEFRDRSRVKIVRAWQVQNDQGTINPDHRGSNHVGIEFDHLFDGSVLIEPGEYDVLDLADLLWRIKGNKFDHQYELMLTMTPEDGEEIQDEVIQIEPDIVYINVAVDHGS